MFSVNITFPLGFVSGNITVFGSNGCGNGPSRIVAVRSTPGQPAFITGIAFMTCGTSGIVYNTIGSTGATSYAWTVPAGVNITNISLNQLSITVTYTGSFSGSGSICIIPSNSCGVGIQRCLGVACEVAPIQSSNDAARTAIFATPVNAYPNPTSGKLNVSFNAAIKEKYILKVIDLIGKVVISYSGVAEEEVNLQEIDLRSYAKGMYLLSIEREGVKSQTMRIIIE
jgi:hypothetical protein